MRFEWVRIGFEFRNIYIYIHGSKVWKVHTTKKKKENSISYRTARRKRDSSR